MDAVDPFRPFEPGAAPLTTLLIANGPTLVAAGADQPGPATVYLGHLDDAPGPLPTPTLAPGSQDTSCGPTPCGP